MHSDDLKFETAIQNAAIVNNTSATSAIIDTKDCAEIEYVFQLGATDIALTALKVQESADGTSFTSPADITGTVGGTDFTLPTATDDNKLYGFKVQIKGDRKRYQKLICTVGNGSTGAYVAAIAVKSRLAASPSSAAGRGFAAYVTV